MWAGLIVSVVLGAVGQVLMKVGMKAAGPMPAPLEAGLQGLFLYFSGAIFSWPVLLAFACYGTSFLLWLGVLSVADLSLARPVMSFGYFITLAYGFWAGEDVTWERVLGTVLIVAGIVFVARSGPGG